MSDESDMSMNANENEDSVEFSSDQTEEYTDSDTSKKIDDESTTEDENFNYQKNINQQSDKFYNIKKRKPIKNEPVKSNKRYFSLNYLSLIILILTMTIYFMLSKTSRIDYKEMEEFKKFLKDNENIIGDIGKRTLKAAIDNSLNKEQTIFILIIGQYEQRRQIEEFFESLVSLIFKFKDKTFNKEDIIKLNNNVTSEYIDSMYTKTFKIKKEPVIMFENLELISPSVAVTFHQYSDAEESRIKSFTIATLKSEPYFDQLNIKPFNLTMLSTEKISKHILTKLWCSTLKNDTLDCLINRIGQYPIVLQQLETYY